MSDLIPNSYQTPNAYVDRFMYLVTPEEWKVLSYAARRIFGFQKRQDRISLSQFIHGTVSRSDGHQLDRGTGMSKPAVIKALKSLLNYRIMLEVAKNDSHLNHGSLYELQLDSDKIDIAGLIDRANNANQANRKRSESAREKASELLETTRSVGLTGSKPADPVSGTDRDRSVGLTGIGQSDRPGPVSGTDTQNQEETKHKPSNGWMDEDAIAQFLLGLPGFNVEFVEATRREIVSHHYELEELPWLWSECAAGQNPIGLFSYKVTAGQHSAAYQMDKIEREKLTKQQSAASKNVASKKSAKKSEPALEPDASVTPEHLQLWQQIVGEIASNVQPQTYAAYIAPARPISINGAWTIAVPAVEWWEGKMSKDLPRLYRKLTGAETHFNFVKDVQS